MAANIRTVPRELRPTVRRLLREGWTIHKGRGGHLKLRHPSGETVVTGSSPSRGNRAVENAKAMIRRVERRHEES